MRYKGLSILLLAALSLWAADRARETKLQQAIDLMGTKGDLAGAAKLLEDVAKSSDRNLAARGLLYLGDCREKLGQRESRQSYERIVKEFADQKDVAAEAGKRLAGMGGRTSGQGKEDRMLWQIPREVWYTGGYGNISPDGRYIACFKYPDGDWQNGVAEFFLHDLVTGEDRLVAGLEDIYPSFSPDGKRLAYSTFTNGLHELRIRSTDGSGMRVLWSTKDRRIDGAGWSSDGKRILTTTQAIRLPPPGGRGAQPVDPADQPPNEIVLVSVSDGSVQVVKSAQGIRASGFSPDGKYILYFHMNSGQLFRSRPFFAISADGKTETQLISAEWDAMSPVWTPDGSHILFSSKRYGGPGLWSLRVSDGKPEGEPELLREADIEPQGFARDGSLLYATFMILRNINVAGLDPATGKLTSQPKPVNGKFVGNHGAGPISWSPDGKILLFRKNDQGNPANSRTIVVHSVGAGEEYDLPGKYVPPAGPWFFPDGLSLMFSGPDVQMWQRIDVGSGETKEAWKSPVAGPGPRQSAFASDPRVRFGFKKDMATDCQGDICLFPLVRVDMGDDKVTTVSQIRATKSGLIDISISADDRQLAFVIRNSDGGQSFMVVPAAGGTPREVYRAGNNFLIGGTSQTKDGKHILAFGRQGGRPALYSIPVDGGQPAVSALAIEPSDFGNSPVVSPDGTRIAFAGGPERAELRVMTGLSGPAPAAR